MSNSKIFVKNVLAWVLIGSVALLIGWAVLPGSLSTASAEETQLQAGPPPPGMERATFAAGCFWSMEAIFSQLEGVSSVFPGYAGGTVQHPSYELVETGTTGYAESVNITFDPKVISYKQLLTVLLTVRDPTTVDQQGPDVGSQYRSIIFYRNEQQHEQALQAIHEISKSHIWSAPIVTQLVPFTTFYRAESYHLNYYNLHPTQDYCAFVIAPEISKFRAKFPSLLKS